MGVDGGASASSSAKAIEAMHAEARFLPFTRRDQYGHMGLKPQPLHERARLAVMSATLMPLKLAISLSIVLICFLTCKFSELLPKSVRSDFCAATGKVYARGLVFCLGLNVRWIKVKQPGTTTKPEPRAAGLISNHCSWADILIHLARYWCSFAAREGTEKLLMIGQISLSVGCVYVNRKKESGSQGVSAQIKARMTAKMENPNNSDRLMLLFPEGTTTNGRYLLPFKTGAFLAGVPLQPVIIKYDQDSPFCPSWETIDVWRHIWLLLCQPYHNVTCYELPIYEPSPEERADPALYANNMREYMLKYSKMEPSETTFGAKMLYHDALFRGKAAPPP